MGASAATPGAGGAAHRAATLRQLPWASSGAQVRGLKFFGDVRRVRDWLAHPTTRTPGTNYLCDQTVTSVIERTLAAAGGPMACSEGAA